MGDDFKTGGWGGGGGGGGVDTPLQTMFQAYIY